MLTGSDNLSSMVGRNKVAYFYDSEFATFYFGENHPMKPHRLAMTHHLVLGYELHRNMEVYRPRKACPAELAQFHAEDYISFLRQITPANVVRMPAEMRTYNLNDDCPVFEGLFDYVGLYAGASVQGACMLNNGQVDIAINWSGGLHHAKKTEASGFCYINDLVLAILELLKVHARVLYVDIDVHHGDGVEEAFYLTDRVMCVSFHKYGDFFFPGTGDLQDIGEQNGRCHTVNVPLKDGTDDKTFHRLYRPIMDKVMEVFKPGAIVMQCGADSLAHDRLGCFNLSLKGHGEAVEYLKRFGVPMLVTGGGGYTKHNVARCWTYETAILTESVIPHELPKTDYHEYFKPDYSLNVNAHKIREDQNSKAEVENILRYVLENLNGLSYCPSVLMDELPPDHMLVNYWQEEDKETEIPRLRKYCKEHCMLKGELFENDYDQVGE